MFRGPLAVLFSDCALTPGKSQEQLRSGLLRTYRYLPEPPENAITQTWIRRDQQESAA
jgi:hypothetical protein